MVPSGNLACVVGRGVGRVGGTLGGVWSAPCPSSMLAPWLATLGVSLFVCEDWPADPDIWPRFNQHVEDMIYFG